MKFRIVGIEFWAAIKELGCVLIERNCAQARQFAKGFRKAGFGVPYDVVINQVMVSFGDDEKTKRVMAAI